MRHHVFGRKLGRDINSRHALLRNLASSIMVSGYVVTTETKAKFAKSYIEKIIRNSQKNSLALQRSIASELEKKAFIRLVNEIGPGFADRNGGYTRLTRIRPRKGDGAILAKLELLNWDTTKAKAPAVSQRS
ncbi:50S ribosomal protein L17 [Candidatus Curtissbacteria bacterium]|nr:50S ribosomal protein L17 [Candidatus Curtissbacteria bacterium]